MPSAKSTDSYESSAILMDTLVSIEVVSPASPERAHEAVARAFGWFEEVEARCSRFEPDSELMLLCSHAGEPVEVSPLLFRAIEFAVELARLTGGAFDPAIGRRLEAMGFDESYKTGARVSSSPRAAAAATYRDIELDVGRSTVTLRKAMVIDLGAVAKGFAMDLAAQELAGFPGFCIDAGGDILVRGHSGGAEPWAVGIQHPRHADEVLEVLSVTGGAVCTSGDYERVAPDGAPHIIDPRGGKSAPVVASVTVAAPTAMAADGLSTAAFVLGPEAGLRLLRSQHVEGLIVSTALEQHETPGFGSLR